jgi:class 3 adenylate cyclase
VAFVGRRHREAAEELIRALGGMPSEGAGGPLVAVFDGPDIRTRSIAAVEAALAILAECPPDAEAGESPPIVANAAIIVGPAQVGSIRVREADESRWVYGAAGEPVERASDLVRGASGTGVMAAGDAAAVVSDRFRLQSVGDGVYRVLTPITDGDETDAAPPPDRQIRTILMTDIVDSTRTAERVGDRAWGELLAAHEDAVRGELVVFGGEEIDTTGDGFVVSFDSPARAIRCALAVLDRVAALGLMIRVGINTGEVEYVEGRPRGIALHVASRIAARATPGEILVDATTRELAAGAGLAFVDRGVHTLKGVSENKQLFAVIEALK